MLRKTALFVLITCATLLSVASPASAHSVSGVGATNFKSQLTGVEPNTDDVNVKIIEAGSRLELAYLGKDTLIVYGYQDEPYLMITPKGVWRNENSPATYINMSRNGSTDIPPTANPKADPEWKKISDEPVARWHDHNIHWMSPNLPPAVADNQGKEQVVTPNWKVGFAIGEQKYNIVGDLIWVPSDSAAPWILYMVGVALLVGFLIQLPKARWIVLPLSIFGFLLSDILFRWGILRGISEPLATVLNDDAEVLVVSQVAWIGLLFTLYLALRKKNDAYVAAIFCAVPLTIVSGLYDIPILWKSQIPSLYSTGMTRFLLATQISLGIALSLGCLTYLIRNREQRQQQLGAKTKS